MRKRLQQQETNIETLKHKLQHNKLDKEYYSMDENGLLTKKVVDGGHKFHAIYLPNVLVFKVLQTVHDDLGHNGFLRTYAALKRVFYWKGMKGDIRKHCKTCATCMLHMLENVKFERKIFKPSLQPMDFICMDLIGEFHPPTSHGHCYALTAVCMLTGFTWCVPLKTKTAEEVSKAYLDHIYSNFGGSVKIMTDNGTEFKNKLFKEVVEKLGTEFSIHSPPYKTTKQWEDRGIPQVPENVYRQTHQPRIGMGRTHTSGNSMLQLFPKLQCQRISILHHVWERPNQQTQHVTAFSKKIFS